VVADFCGSRFGSCDFYFSFFFSLGDSFMIQIVLNVIGVIGMCAAVCFGMYIEIFLKQTPCILCFLQRSSMLMVALGLYWNIAYGVHARHYAFSLLGTILGLACVLRHMALNVCKPVGPDTFFFGCCRIYSWSFIVFYLALVGISILLFFYKPGVRASSRTGKRILGWGLLLILAASLVSSFCHRGFGF
jgi:disulfide bond formation protein DsbB